MKKAKKTRFLKEIDVDKVRIVRDDYFSNAYIVDLPLDSTPDHVWQDFFEQEWKSSRLLWERKLYLVGSHLRLVTPPESIREKLDWAREILNKTNRRIEEYNQELETREAEMEDQVIRKRAELEKATIKGIRDVLKDRLRTF
ncbi:MAG: hypothetical protein JSW72_06725 [Candidatus Bathyarchaeota archaeon]|nr:MAG: hypothetical protein JSW72_06725 [Candidatus Bathyarchaeota archaeon]